MPVLGGVPGVWGSETRDAAQYPTVHETPHHPAPRVTGAKVGRAPLESPERPTWAWALAEGALTGPTMLYQAGPAVGGPSVGRGHQNPTLSARCSPTICTESEPESRWGLEPEQGGTAGISNRANGESSGFIERKGVEGFAVVEIHIFSHKLHIHYELITERPQEGRGFKQSWGTGAAGEDMGHALQSPEPCPCAHTGRGYEKVLSWG